MCNFTEFLFTICTILSFFKEIGNFMWNQTCMIWHPISLNICCKRRIQSKKNLSYVIDLESNFTDFCSEIDFRIAFFSGSNPICIYRHHLWILKWFLPSRIFYIFETALLLCHSLPKDFLMYYIVSTFMIDIYLLVFIIIKKIIQLDYDFFRNNMCCINIALSSLKIIQ